MVLRKIGEAFDKLEREEPARTVDVFRTFASLSRDASTLDGFHGEVRVLRNSFGSNTAGVFSYPEVILLKASISLRSIGLGWLWFAGTTTLGGQRHRLFFPAVSMPIDVDSVYLVINSVKLTDEPQLFGLVQNEADLDALSERLTTELKWDEIRRTRGGRLTNPSKWVDPDVLRPWIDDYARACGFEVSEVRHDDPGDHIEKEGITAHIGTCLIDHGTRYISRQAFDLNELDRLKSVAGTSFNAMYGVEVDLEENQETSLTRDLVSLRRLSNRQRTVAERIAGSRLSALSGAPGTGKTHIISVVAADAIARGESVLVVAGSPHAVDALVDHFFETPGPPPVTFGGAQHGSRLTEELAKVSELIDEENKLAPEKLQAAAAHDARAKAVRDALETMLERGEGESPTVRSNIGELLNQLVVGEVKASEIAGELLTNHWISKLNLNTKKTLTNVGEISQLPAMERRKQFASINPSYLAKVLPLWVGSVDDVDDVLPTFMAMFDLVIIDEAAQIDQVRAANSLIRAKRALVCGDPAQIGIDNAPTDEELRVAKAEHGTTDNDFDVQNRSIFDVAASRVPVEVLDEHFRSVPHLIEFSSRRFYDGGLYTATRNPANEAADHIDLCVVDGQRDASGVNVAEVEQSMLVLDLYIESGSRNIGLVTPFEVQAEALEEAVQRRYTEGQIKDLNILVGTVNELQGHERDQMIISFCVGTNESERAWDLVNNERFFNVMVTRARHHATVITSSANPPGLAGEYVKWTEPLVDLVGDDDILDPWILQVADTLRRAGIPIRTGYRVGRHVIDVVAGEGELAVAIDCTVHPDGVDSHIDRALMLRRTGWRTADAFEQEWRFLLDDYAMSLRDSFPDL